MPNTLSQPTRQVRVRDAIGGKYAVWNGKTDNPSSAHRPYAKQAEEVARQINGKRTEAWLKFGSEFAP